MLLPPSQARPITAGFVKFAGGPKEKGALNPVTAFTQASEESLVQFGSPRTVPGTDKNVRTDRVTDVRASFARNYGSKGGLAKSADAQRQAFTRALKAALAEGPVSQDSWEADWLWREDDPFSQPRGC
jgi:hypothetical protein